MEDDTNAVFGQRFQTTLFRLSMILCAFWLTAELVTHEANCLLDMGHVANSHPLRSCENAAPYS
jgi:hypothetical protein